MSGPIRARSGVLLLATAAAGAALCAAGAWLGDRAVDDLVTTTSRVMSRARDIDRVAVLADAGRHTEALDLLREQAAEELDAEARAAFAGAEAAVATKIPANAEAGIAPLRAALSRFLERQWTRSGEDRRLGLVLIALGAALCLACAALAVLGRGVAAAVAKTEIEEDDENLEAEDTEDAPTQGPPAESLGDILRDRLDDLYATRLRASDTERLAVYGELAAGLHHSLKAPLASIRAAAQVAQLRVGPEHAATPRLVEIISVVDSLVEQIRRLLKTAGAGGGAQERIRPGQLVEKMAQAYEQAARSRGVRCRTDIKPGVLDVEIDPILMELALRNLIENALSASPRGAEIGLLVRGCTPPRRAGLDDAAPGGGDWIEIVVRDQGPGLPGPVTEGGAAASSKPTGSGLGVSLARRIVLREGGALEFETKPGRGTAARVVLRAVKLQARPPEEARPS